MSFGFEWRPYVSVAKRRLRAEREAAKLRKKGRAIAPVTIEGRKITKNFWGQSWCMNLERYSDFASRLPRGRSYVCNGLVIDLQIRKGQVSAIVSGSELYDVKVTIAPVARPAGSDLPGLHGIDRLFGGLLQGRLAKGHGPGVPGRRRPVSGAGRNQALLQLSVGPTCASTSPRSSTVSAPGSKSSRNCCSCCAAPRRRTGRGSGTGSRVETLARRGQRPRRRRCRGAVRSRDGGGRCGCLLRRIRRRCQTGRRRKRCRGTSGAEGTIAAQACDRRTGAEEHSPAPRKKRVLDQAVRRAGHRKVLERAIVIE